MASVVLKKVVDKDDYENLDGSSGAGKTRFKVSFVKKRKDDSEKRYLVDNVASQVDTNLALFEDEMKERPMISTFMSAIERYSAMSVSCPDQDGEDPRPQCAQKKMGTVMGVYLPCVQNILGVILFVRLTWIVGLAGILQSLFIVILCCCTTLLTAISMSAIATNGVVPAGGSYFMISRALGPEFGGAVGVLFYLGTTFASAMYILGAVEILVTYIAPQIRLFGDITGPANRGNLLNNFRVYGSCFLVLMSSLVFFGVKYVNRFASLFLACVIVSILAIFAGVLKSAVSPPAQQLCYLGDRLIEFGTDGLCEKGNLTYPSSIDQIYCYPNETFDSNSTIPRCDPYYDSNNLKTMLAIPGLGSNVSSVNFASSYLTKNQLIITKGVDDVDALQPDADFRPSPNYPSWLYADITSSFTILLAIFFPSVTGIMAGSNRSGDLADAQRSIPTGTIGAVLTTAFIYISTVVFFGACVEGSLLRDKFGDSIGGELIVSLLAWPSKWIVLIGAFLSTIGAGLQSLVGAPRLLQAIAKDGIIPFLKVFGKGKESNGDPTWALLLTVFISLIGILIADLELVAPIITMFFLMCYAFVNVACALQTLLQTPGWRPRFKYYHWVLSSIGLGLCVALMFISSWIYTLLALLLAASIHKYIEYSGAEKEWGDGLRGLQLTTARYALLRLEERAPHTKNWRPQLLILIKPDEDLMPKHPNMFDLADQLKAGKGLTIVSSVLPGNPVDIYPESNRCQEELRQVLEERKMKGFARAIVCPDVSDGLNALIQSSGLGGLRHNTIMMGWPYRWRSKDDGYSVFLNTIKTASAFNLAVIVPKNIMNFPSRTDRLHGTIDVWWIVHDGGLLMLLPFLLRQHKSWKQCTMRIFTVAQLEDNSIQLKKDLENFLYQLRIEAEIEVIEMQTSDISAYTYERTLLMEQRSEILNQLNLTKQKLDFSTFGSKPNKSRLEIGNNSINSSDNEMTWMPQTLARLDDINASLANNLTETEKLNKNRSAATVNLAKEEVNEDLTNQMRDSKSDPSFGNLNNIVPKSNNVRRMHTAVKLNETIVNRSHQAQLVILNLPGPPKKKEASREANYMEFLEVLTEGLDRVMMVRGGGREVITMYS